MLRKIAHHCVIRPTFVLVALVVATSLIGSPPPASAEREKAKLIGTGADADASGKASLNVRRRKGALTGKLTVVGKKLEGDRSYEVTVDGIRLGTLETNRRGKGKARFRTNPRPGKDQLLGVDPRGRSVALLDDGATVLLGGMDDSSSDDGDIRCCLPDDSGTECEDRTPAECVAQGGVDLGPGSCLPDPCSGDTVELDVVCCLPDDSGPECEDRTAAQCAAEGGVSLGAGSCLPDPCAPIAPPDGDIRCCLPDDSGTECEDRTAAECATQGGVNIGPGSCTPSPCFPDGVTPPPPVPADALARVTCELRSDRSRASVNGQNLTSGSYSARITSGANVATSAPVATIGDEVEFDFDSEPDDIAAGATAIESNFVGGGTPAVTGEILDGDGAVVASATVTCRVRD
ncbi:MAG: hypothetical protein OEP95_14735 [Myxococcales bacterium]|nr:hypothetical protein [Myxococcales bacterium]